MPAKNESGRPVRFSDLRERLAGQGLAARGGFHPAMNDVVPRGGVFGDPATLVLVGVVGRNVWPTFEAFRDDGANPLDSWTKRVVDGIAATFGGVPVYPNDKPFWPFQQWAQRCEPVSPSPLGLLIHPEYGLWHAYRAALVFSQALDLPAPATDPSPCVTCADRPCLSGCPVGAFSEAGYDVPTCADHLRSDAGATCLSGGCMARNACPVGPTHRYVDPQVRFHMAAFNRSINGAG